MDNFDMEAPAIAPAQRSEGWHSQRCGILTASRIKDVLAVSKRDGKPLQARADYLMEKVCEILTGKPVSKFQNEAMRWGVEWEPVALEAYQRHTGRIVTAAGLCMHPSLDYIGASPDGLMTDRGIEIKCPFNSAVHIRTILDGMPDEHMAQTQSGMWICDMPEWDFVSFDSRMPDHVALYIQTIQRDDAFIANMATECGRFWLDVCEMVARISDKTRAAGIGRLAA